MESIELLWTGLASAAVTVAFFGGIALIMWVDARNKRLVRQMEHAERLKALELGQTLPDAELARARVESSRAWAAGLMGLVVPGSVFGIAAGATALVLAYASPSIHLPLLCVIWGISGLTGLLTVIISLGTIRPAPEETNETPPGDELEEKGEFSDRIKASSFPD